jgi:hypothetical protein
MYERLFILNFINKEVKDMIEIMKDLIDDWTLKIMILSILFVLTLEALRLIRLISNKLYNFLLCSNKSENENENENEIKVKYENKFFDDIFYGLNRITLHSKLFDLKIILIDIIKYLRTMNIKMPSIIEKYYCPLIEKFNGQLSLKELESELILVQEKSIEQIKENLICIYKEMQKEAIPDLEADLEVMKRLKKRNNQ